MQSPLAELAGQSGTSSGLGRDGLARQDLSDSRITAQQQEADVRRRRYQIERLTHWISSLLSVNGGRWRPVNGFERVFFCDRAVSRAFAYSEDELNNPGIVFPVELSWLAEMDWLKIAYDDNSEHGACCLFMFYLDGVPFAMAFHLDNTIYRRLCDTNPLFLQLGIMNGPNIGTTQLVPIERGFVQTAASNQRR